MKSLFVLLIFFWHASQAQMALIDRGVQVEELWCFPLHGDSTTYVYLPFQAELGQNASGMPEFSYMRYMINKQAGIADSLQKEDGGAILNFLVKYGTPQEKVKTAEDALRKKLKNDSLKIRGPLIFSGGRYSLISTIISGDSLVKKKEILSIGKAPVLENSRVALSFGLSPLSSSILLENFKMNTPDVSLVFDMEFSGLTEDYDAILEIDWSEVKKSEGFNAGANIYFVAADVKLAFDELFKKQAIRLTVNGSNASMDALLQTVYDKLLNLLFAPVEPEQLPAQQQQGLLSTLTQALAGQGGAFSSKNTTGFGLQVGYQLKEMKSTGTSRLVFKGKSTVDRHHYIVFNIGDLYKRWGADNTVFRDVPVGHDAFSNRKIIVGVDGDLEQEFDRMINSVTVMMNKEHGNGRTTSQSLLINKSSRTTEPAFFYGYQNDTAGWMNYKQRSVWQFKGGATYESPWQDQDASMINLFVPYKRSTIRLEGDMNRLTQQGIRALSVQIQYPFFTETKHDRITVSTQQALGDKYFEITQPNDQPTVDYSISWIKNDGTTIEKKGTDKVGMIFVDELPAQ